MIDLKIVDKGMIEHVRKNLSAERAMLREISVALTKLEHSSQVEQKLIIQSVSALKNSIVKINDSLPDLLNEITVADEKSEERPAVPLEQISFQNSKEQVSVTLPQKSREAFLKELTLNEEIKKRLQRKSGAHDEEQQEYKSSRGYLKLSNKVFMSQAEDFFAKGYFRGLSLALRRANFDIMPSSYIAMTLLTTLISVFVGVILLGIISFFEVSLSWPVLTLSEENFLFRFLKFIWLPILIPIATFMSIYFYPEIERDSIESHIDQELPFAVVHMSAIAGSGISPVEIFKIIGTSGDYPYLRKEMRKVINQLNLYGYDIITALSNVAQGTPSTKLSELLSGIATTLYSGGDLPKFFERRSRTLLTSYRLEREKYTKVAETFMDMYISVIIAAPMILMIILILISIQGIGPKLSPFQMSILISAAIAFLNVLFLGFLHLKQPGY